MEGNVYCLTSIGLEEQSYYKIGKTGETQLELENQYRRYLPSCKVIKFNAVSDNTETEKKLLESLAKHRVGKSEYVRCDIRVITMAWNKILGLKVKEEEPVIVKPKDVKPKEKRIKFEGEEYESIKRVIPLDKEEEEKDTEDDTPKETKRTRKKKLVTKTKLKEYARTYDITGRSKMDTPELLAAFSKDQLLKIINECTIKGATKDSTREQLAQLIASEMTK